jgi:hypothetical protein
MEHVQVGGADPRRRDAHEHLDALDAVDQGIDAFDQLQTVEKRDKQAADAKAEAEADRRATARGAERIRAAEYGEERWWRPRGLFELVLILLVLLGVPSAALIWDTVYGTDEPVTNSVTEAPVKPSGQEPSPGASSGSTNCTQSSNRGKARTERCARDITGTYNVIMTVTAAGEKCTNSSFTLDATKTGVTGHLNNGNTSLPVNNDGFELAGKDGYFRGKFDTSGSGPVTLRGGVKITFNFPNSAPSSCTWSLDGTCTTGPCLGRTS